MLAVQTEKRKFYLYERKEGNRMKFPRAKLCFRGNSEMELSPDKRLVFLLGLLFIARRDKYSCTMNFIRLKIVSPALRI